MYQRYGWLTSIEIEAFLQYVHGNFSSQFTGAKYNLLVGMHRVDSS